MAHGGTNFGFFSGANTDSNDESAYKPDLTSYDYVSIYPKFLYLQLDPIKILFADKISHFTVPIQTHGSFKLFILNH